MSDHTVQINISDENKKAGTEQLLKSLDLVYKALEEKGYDPINQLVEYILSNDPTYITSYNGARNEMKNIKRFDLLHIIFSEFFKEK